MLRDRDRQYLLIIHWLGFRQTAIDIDQQDRYAGRSAYSFSSLARVAVDGMFFQSTVLLRRIVYAGFAAASLGIALVAYTLYVLAVGRHLPQWTGLPMLILLLTGFMLVSTGVTGLYVGKIFTQVKGRRSTSSTCASTRASSTPWATPSPSTGWRRWERTPRRPRPQPRRGGRTRVSPASSWARPRARRRARRDQRSWRRTRCTAAGA
ncbi:MAG TPA: hypothetical protein VIM22_03975 [Solirubrobacteraceae bacterium]